MEGEERKIVIAVNKHSESEQAFEFAITNLRRPGDRFILLNVSGNPKTDSLFVGLVLSDLIVGDITKAYEHSKRELDAKYRKLCEKHQIKFEIEHLEGEPGPAIEQAVKRIAPSIVVVGSRGLGTIGRAFLESVSNYLVHNLTVPVLVVKSTETN